MKMKPNEILHDLVSCLYDLAHLFGFAGLDLPAEEWDGESITIVEIGYVENLKYVCKKQ